MSNVFVALVPAVVGGALGLFGPGAAGRPAPGGWRVWALAWAAAAIVAEVSMLMLAGMGAADNVVQGAGGLLLPGIAAWVYARSTLP